MPCAATWMDPKTVTLSKPDKDKHDMIVLMWNLKKINELIYKTEINPDTENKFMVTKGERGAQDFTKGKLGAWD